MTTALLPTRLESRPPRRQSRVKGAQVLLLARPQLSETFKKTHCYSDLQRNSAAWALAEPLAGEWVRAAEAAVPSLSYCCAPPLATSGAETLSVSFLINNVIYHKLTLQLYSEPKRYFTVCCVYSKHSKGCVSISYKHNKYNHQRKSSHLLRIRSI